VEVRDDTDIPGEVEIDHMTVAPDHQVDSVGGTHDAVQQAVATAGLIGQRRIYEVDYLGHGNFWFYFFPVAKSICREGVRHRLLTKLRQCPASFSKLEAITLGRTVFISPLRADGRSPVTPERGSPLRRLPPGGRLARDPA
jgi:hypothetical protein